MRIITDQNFRTIDSIVASSVASGFPASNLQQYDPGLIWKAAAFSSAVNLVIDLAVASAIDQIWLNNANFTSATIEANDADSWTSPAFSKAVTLAEDDIGIFKGFFDLTETHYRFVRIVIPVQSLTDGGSVPFLGNVILGVAESLTIASWEPGTTRKFDKFQPDSGGYRRNSKGRDRHIFAASMSGTNAEIFQTPLKGWEVGVLFTDLDSVADSYLVYSPESKRGFVRNPVDAGISFTLEEYV